jgi:hypothetical protein
VNRSLVLNKRNIIREQFWVIGEVWTLETRDDDGKFVVLTKGLNEPSIGYEYEATQGLVHPVRVNFSATCRRFVDSALLRLTRE